MKIFFKNNGRLALLIIFGVLIIDQVIKVIVKTTFYQGEEVSVFGNWFILHFVENPGFAFGMKFGGKVGKLILTLFRIVAITAIGWYLTSLIKQKVDRIIIVSIALIFSGALGNLIDSCFYGVLFSESLYEVAEFLPKEGGYAPLLFGNVVDMFYLPIIDTYLPEWLPIWGGRHCIFFRPIFNVADVAITAGVLLLIIYSLFLSKKKPVITDGESH